MRLEEVPEPTPGDHEVLVAVHAASANAADWHMQRARPFLIRFASGLFRPKAKIPGADFAGTVTRIGKDVRSLKVGDEVFGDLSSGNWGAFAESVAAPENKVAIKPKKVSFEQAAATPLAAMTALQGLRDHARLRPGQKVLVNGASGGVGTFAVQIAKEFGATVTGVCSTRNLAMVRKLGADHVIDYTKQDFTQNGEQYDVILDTACHRAIGKHRKSLTPTGIYLMVGGTTASFLGIMIKGPWMSRKHGRRFSFFMQRAAKADLEYLAKLLASGKMVAAVDRRYDLKGVPKAIAYLEDAHTQGKVVIQVAKTGRR